MNGSVVPIGRAVATASWRLRPWPNDPTSVLLVFTDHAAVPDAGEFHAAATRAKALGAERLRTSALFPRAAEVAIAAGLRPIDTLALLRHQLDGRQRGRVGRSASSGHRTRAMRAWHHAQAASVDRAAFGAMWGNDDTSLAEIRTATPIHRARMITDGRALSGFAISGAGGSNGYIQRLAVAPDHQRLGIGRQLVEDALDWMRARHLSAAFVNTGIANEPALRLYEALGFVCLDDRLTIAELDLTA